MNAQISSSIFNTSLMGLVIAGRTLQKDHVEVTVEDSCPGKDRYCVLDTEGNRYFGTIKAFFFTEDGVAEKAKADKEKIIPFFSGIEVRVDLACFESLKPGMKRVEAKFKAIAEELKGPSEKKKEIPETTYLMRKETKDNQMSLKFDARGLCIIAEGVIELFETYAEAILVVARTGLLRKFKAVADLLDAKVKIREQELKDLNK